MRDDKQWKISDKGEMIHIGEYQIKGNDRQWEMTDSKLQTMLNGRQWGMINNWKWWTMENDSHG